MKLLLALLFLTAAGAAYYETKVQRQTAPSFQAQEAEWTRQDDALRAVNKHLAADRATLEAKMTKIKGEIASLNAEITATKAKIPPPAPKIVSTPKPPPPRAPNDLGDIVTKTGQTFTSCTLLKVEADGIVVSSSQEITKVHFFDLPDDLRKRFFPVGEAPATSPP